MIPLSVGEIFGFAFGQIFAGRTLKTIILPVAGLYAGISAVFYVLLGGGGVGVLLQTVLTSMALVVALVRVHRQYIMDEERPLFLPATLSAGYYWAYIWRALILTLIVLAPYLIVGLLAATNLGLGTLGLIGTVAFIIYTLRWQLVLPAAAVGDNLTFDESAARFDGYKMSYFWAAFLLTLVFGLINVFITFSMGVSVIFSGGAGAMSLTAVLWLILSALVVVFSSAAYAFALSYVYKHTQSDATEAAQEIGANQTYGRPDYGSDDY